MTSRDHTNVPSKYSHETKEPIGDTHQICTKTVEQILKRKQNGAERGKEKKMKKKKEKKKKKTKECNNIPKETARQIDSEKTNKRSRDQHEKLCGSMLVSKTAALTFR